MYIQNERQTALPFSLPKGYSGSAFDTLQKAGGAKAPPIPASTDPQKEAPPEEPVQGEAPVGERESDTATPEAREENQATNAHTDEENASDDAVSAFSHAKDSTHRDHGIFSRLPFLSSLLPPPRKGRGGKDALPEWVILGIVLFLLLDTPENDLLPFLLILLLWD